MSLVNASPHPTKRDTTGSASNPRTKTRRTGSNRVVTIAAGSISTGKEASYSLGIPDVIEVVSILQGSTDVTDRFSLDDGQRDGFYDLAKIVRKAMQQP